MTFLQQFVARLRAHPGMCKCWVAVRPLHEEGGAVYLSAIADGAERIGMAHAYVWDRKAMGKPEMARLAFLELMRSEHLDRLTCEIDMQNRLALQFARRIGYQEIGKVRQRRDYRGEPRDVILMDALPEDLNGRHS